MAASAEVLSEILHAKDRGIPEDLLAKAQCVGIVPSLKRAGFIVGAKYGKGEVVCRTDRGWSAPATIRIEGGSFGFQIGAGETDLVFIVMNRHGVRDLMKDKFTLGGDASCDGGAGGPFGRGSNRRVDARRNPRRTPGRTAFSRECRWKGRRCVPTMTITANCTGRDVTQREILTGQVGRPAVARPIYAELDRYAS